MKTFEESVPDSFAQVDGRWVFAFGPGDRYTLELEPEIGGNVVVALYEKQDGAAYPDLMLRDKVLVRPVRRGDRF
jgi:hypothetical protein